MPKYKRNPQYIQYAEFKRRFKDLQKQADKLYSEYLQESMDIFIENAPEIDYEENMEYFKEIFDGWVGLALTGLLFMGTPYLISPRIMNLAKEQAASDLEQRLIQVAPELVPED